MVESYSQAGSSSSVFFVYNPDDLGTAAASVPDTDTEWQKLLDNPKVILVEGGTPEERARDSRAKKTAHSRAVGGSPTTRRSEIGATTALVLDADEFRPGRPPFTADEIRGFFEGYRVICWTSFSSTAKARRWRIVIPLATPCPPTKHVPLFRKIVSEVLEGTVPDNQRHPGRLGFFATVGSADPGDYEWFTTQGEYLDWRAFSLPDEAIVTLDARPADLTQKPGWTSRDEALKTARRRYAATGRGIGPGERHQILFVTACQLLWDWAADEAFAVEILNLVNGNFSEPKDEASVSNEVERAYDRVIGDNRVAQHVPYGVEREPESQVSKGAIADRAHSLKSSRKEKGRTLGRTLTRVANNETFTDDPADAEVACYQVVDELARQFPHETPERILGSISQSLGAQRMRSVSHPIPDDAVLTARIHAVQAGIREREERARDDEDNAQKLAIRTAFNSDRDYPYTDREIQSWTDFGPNRWVIQHGSTYYFWVNSEYIGPFEQVSARAAMLILLAPAEGRVPLHTRAKEGVKRRTLEEIVIDHGTVVTSVVKSMMLDRPEVGGRALRLPAAVVRPGLTARRDERVDQWMRLLAGEKYDLFCSWMAKVPQLDSELAAVHMVAPRNSGKNMLAAGLARLWRIAGPLRLETLLDRLEHIDDCPLVFCDEHLPRKWHREFSAKLREFMSQSDHTVNRKNIPTYSVNGFARLIFASNSVDMLAAPKDGAYNSDETDALQSRVLMLNTSGGKEAADYLESLGHDVIAAEIIGEDALARHALWLRENYVDKGPSVRFGVVDASNDFSDYARVLNEGESRVLGWIYAYVMGRGQGNGVLVHNAAMWINSTAVFQQWSLYARDWSVTPRQLGTTLSSIGNIRRPLAIGDAQLNYRRVDLAKLERWIEVSGYDVDEFAQELHRLENWCRQKNVRFP